MSKGLVNGNKQLVQSLGQLCQQHISDAFKKFNELCSSNLVGMAARAESNRLQTLYMDSQRLLRKRRAAIESATIAVVMDHFAALEISVSSAQAKESEAPAESRQPDPKFADSNNLKLLGHEDLEVMIALDNCSSRVREELRGALHQLEGRLKSLLDNTAPIKTLPMSPDAILEAFVAAIDEDMIAVEVQLELIRMFDLSCFDRSYGEMLGVANQLLEDAGFSPVADTVESEPEPAEVDVEVDVDAEQRGSVEKSEQQTGTDQDKVAIEVDQVSEAVANYADNEKSETSELGNTRVQTELLAKITSMLEQAEAVAESESESESETVSKSVSKSGTSSAGAASTVAASANNAAINKGHSQQQPEEQAKQTKQAKPCMDKPQLLAEINKHMNELIATARSC